MNKNIGFIGRGTRGVGGMVLVFVAAKNYFGSNTIALLFFVAGLVLIVESMFGFCLLKRLFYKRNPSVPDSNSTSSHSEV